MPELAVVDANVLYGSFSRDLTIRLGQRGLLRPHWTSRITQEWTSNLSGDRSIPLEKLAQVVVLMERAIEDCLVTGYEIYEPLAGALCAGVRRPCRRSSP